MLFFCADFASEQGTNCTGGARRRSCLAKRMECVELAPAVRCVARVESGSKLHALHTLRAIWFRLCRAEDRRALTRPTNSGATFRIWRASLATPLERETLLMPDAIAESVVTEASSFLNTELPDD